MQVFLRTVLIGGLLAIGGWWTYFFRERVRHHELELAERDQRIEALAQDVSERNNLAGAHPEIVERLTKLHLDWAAEVGAGK